jgi:RNA polymerase sigma factor (sigma-70 family)
MIKGPLGRVLNHIRGLAGAPSADQATDGDLLRRFVARGEEAAFAALLQRHGGLVLGLCRRLLNDEHDSEDAFQATFLVLARKAGSIRKEQSLGSWLYGVAYRIASKARADIARRRGREQEQVAVLVDDPIADVVWRELRTVLDEELNRLPEKYRHPVVLCYLENKTNVEAARQLGWTKGTVSGRLARARELLRARLTRRGLALSGGLMMAALGQGAAAAVPTALVESTVKAATGSAAGPAATAGAVAPSVAAMVEGVLKAMMVTKLKMTAAVLLTLGILGTGVTLLTGQVLAPRAAAAQRGVGKIRAQSASDKDAKDKEDEIVRLKRENERLRKELDLVRKQLEELKTSAAEQADRAEALRRRVEAERRRADEARRAADVQRRRAEVERRRAEQQADEARRQEAAARKRAEEAKAAIDQAISDAEAQRAKAEEAEKKARAEAARQLERARKAQADAQKAAAEAKARRILQEKARRLQEEKRKKEEALKKRDK